MKHCPNCNASYADVTLRFCLQDGTPLVDAPQTDTPTVVLNETQTVVARGRHGGIHIPVGVLERTAWQQSQVTRVAPLQPVKTGSKTAIAVVVTAVVMVVLFSFLGLGAWLMLRNPTDGTAKNRGPNVNIPANIGATATPTATGFPSATPTRTPTPTPQPPPSATPTPAPALKSYPATTRLRMARGAYSTSFSGDLNPGGSRSLVLGCRSGQSLSANLSSGSSCVSIRGGGSSLRTVTSGGDNYISLTNTCSSVVHFSINITII